MIGADLFNCTPSGLGAFKVNSGTTYPLLLLAAVNTGGMFTSLYGERDHYVVIDRQGIVRYQGNQRWPYGQGYHPDEIRACVDSLLAPLVPQRHHTLIRRPAGREHDEPSSPGAAAFSDARLAGASLRVGPEPAHAAVSVVLTNPLGSAVEARVTVHDLAGRRVATLLRGTAAAGATTLVWDGRGPDGREAAPGIYYVRADLAGVRLARRIAVVR